MKKIEMLKHSMLLLAIAIGLAACSREDSPAVPSQTAKGSIIGRWYGEVTGTTFALWNYGRVWQETEFKADGTGTATVYYLMGNAVPVACERYGITYQIGDDGRLTYSGNDRPYQLSAMLRADGRLDATINDKQVELRQVDQAMDANFSEWRGEELIDVPAPARYTVLVYGNAGADMDYIIEEGFWERLQPSLTDKSNVRVVNMYKYGKVTEKTDANIKLPKYGEEGNIVWFELDSQTDLTEINDGGMASVFSAEASQNTKICTPANIRMFMEFSSLECPAEQYVFVIWGHGSGLNPMADIPGKYDEIEPYAATRGVIGDEWVGGEQLDMYELVAGVKATGLDRLNTIFFHNCLMGNIETLSELRGVADLIVASAHILCSDGNILAEYIRGLQQTKTSEEAFHHMMTEARSSWEKEIETESIAEYNPLSPLGGMSNGDLKMLRADGLDAVIDASKRLATRLQALYPTQREAIDRATNQVYRYMAYGIPVVDSLIATFFDLSDYARKLAQNTGDAEMNAISQALDKAFDDAFVEYADVNFNEHRLPHYTLSVCLTSNKAYTSTNAVQSLSRYRIPLLCNYYEGYEQTTFHKLTGWGNWLRLNEQQPEGNPVNQHNDVPSK